MFLPYGITYIELATDLSSLSRKGIGDYSAIYIGGGNTFSLLKKIKEVEFDKHIRQFIKDGGKLYGGSAGAIILGQNIRTCSHMDVNEVGLSDLSGLGLVDRYSIWCHYNESDDSLIQEYYMQEDASVVCIPETGGVSFNGECLYNIGKDNCYIVTNRGNKYKIDPGNFY